MIENLVEQILKEMSTPPDPMEIQFAKPSDSLSDMLKEDEHTEDMFQYYFMNGMRAQIESLIVSEIKEAISMGIGDNEFSGNILHADLSKIKDVYDFMVKDKIYFLGLIKESVDILKDML